MNIDRAAFLSLSVLLACGQSEPPTPPKMPPAETGGKPSVPQPPPTRASAEVAAVPETTEALDYEIPAEAYELSFEDVDADDIAGPDVER